MTQSVRDTDPETRRRMQKVGVHNTPIERTVRSILHRLGYRFTLRRKDLIGKPDIVLPKYKSVVFVHGCFWHGHATCYKGTRRPKRNAAFWENKIAYNTAKDQRVQKELHRLGWNVVVVWECETKDELQLRRHLMEELGRQ
jgi:DNA mismatch endonuclease (patch repair protein)